MSLSTAEKFSINKRYKIVTGEFSHYALMDSLSGVIEKKQHWSFNDAVQEQRNLETASFCM